MTYRLCDQSGTHPSSSSRAASSTQDTSPQNPHHASAFCIVTTPPPIKTQHPPRILCSSSSYHHPHPLSPTQASTAPHSTRDTSFPSHGRHRWIDANLIVKMTLYYSLVSLLSLPGSSSLPSQHHLLYIIPHTSRTYPPRAPSSHHEFDLRTGPQALPLEAPKHFTDYLLSRSSDFSSSRCSSSAP